MIHWTQLDLWDGAEGSMPSPLEPKGWATPQETIRLLVEYRDTETISGWFFAPLGLDNFAQPAEDWGPESPDHVDWSDFPLWFQDPQGRCGLTNEGKELMESLGAVVATDNGGLSYVVDD